MDRRVDERFRKPRRTKGTPFHLQRNYWAVGVIAFGGVSWALMEFIPGVAKVKARMLELTQNSDELNSRIRHIQASWNEPAINTLLTRARERAAYKNEPEPDSWF